MARGTGPAATTAAPRAGTATSTIGWSAPGVEITIVRGGHGSRPAAPRAAWVEGPRRASAGGHDGPLDGGGHGVQVEERDLLQRGQLDQPADEPQVDVARPRGRGHVEGHAVEPRPHHRGVALHARQPELLDVHEHGAAVVGRPQGDQARRVGRLVGGDAPDLGQVAALEPPLPPRLVGREPGSALAGGGREQQLQAVDPGPDPDDRHGRPGRADGPRQVTAGRVHPVGGLVVGDRPPAALGLLQVGGRDRDDRTAGRRRDRRRRIRSSRTTMPAASTAGTPATRNGAMSRPPSSEGAAASSTELVGTIEASDSRSRCRRRGRRRRRGGPVGAGVAPVPGAELGAGVVAGTGPWVDSDPGPVAGVEPGRAAGDANRGPPERAGAAGEPTRQRTGPNRGPAATGPVPPERATGAGQGPIGGGRGRVEGPAATGAGAAGAGTDSAAGGAESGAGRTGPAPPGQEPTR